MSSYDEDDELAEGELPDDGAEPEPDDSAGDDELLSRLRVIEDQPLENRAAAFAQVHDELRSRLDGQ